MVYATKSLLSTQFSSQCHASDDSYLASVMKKKIALVGIFCVYVRMYLAQILDDASFSLNRSLSLSITYGSKKIFF